MILNGMANTGFKHDFLSNSLESKIADSFSAVLDQSSQSIQSYDSLCQVISASIRALGNLEFNVVDFSPEFAGKIIDSVISLESKFYSDPVGVADVLYGLGAMNYHWWRLEGNQQEGLTNMFMESHQSMTNQQLANSIFGFGKLGMNLDWATPNICSSVFNSCLSIMNDSCSRSVSNSPIIAKNDCIAWTSMIYGLRKMSCPWAELDPDFYLAYSNTWFKLNSFMEPIAVGSQLYSLGTMNARWKEFDESLKNCILQTLERTCLHMTLQVIYCFN